MTRLGAAGTVDTESPVECDGPRMLLLEAREVPLGGVRAMSVHRSLPQRDLPLVGAWCFLDRFGPQTTRMRVEPHPHIGLQTVTWPYLGDVHHRDSVGSDVVVRRGALNLMTSGAGIAHSEYSVGDDATPVDALQLWVALPESRRHGPPAFEQHVVLPELELAAAGASRGGAGATGSATVVLGELGGVVSPATVHTPIVGAELRIPPGATVRVPLEPAWEHALVAVHGDAHVADTAGEIAGTAAATEVAEHAAAVAHVAGADIDPEGTATEIAATEVAGIHAGTATQTTDAVTTAPALGVGLDTAHLLYLGTRRREVVISSRDGATLFLLGGEPFEDDIVMWWNFVGRSHDEIAVAREAWESASDRFGRVIDHGDERIPAPPMPAVRLTRRRRRL